MARTVAPPSHCNKARRSIVVGAGGWYAFTTWFDARDRIGMRRVDCDVISVARAFALLLNVAGDKLG